MDALLLLFFHVPLHRMPALLFILCRNLTDSVWLSLLPRDFPFPLVTGGSVASHELPGALGLRLREVKGKGEGKGHQEDGEGCLNGSLSKQLSYIKK